MKTICSTIPSFSFSPLLSLPILQFWLRCQFYNSSCWLLKGMTTPCLAYFIKRTERDCLRKHRVCTQKIAVSSETFWLKLFHCNPTFLDIWADLPEAWRWDLFNCFIRVGVFLFKEQERKRRRLFVMNLYCYVNSTAFAAILLVFFFFQYGLMIGEYMMVTVCWSSVGINKITVTYSRYNIIYSRSISEFSLRKKCLLCQYALHELIQSR